MAQVSYGTITVSDLTDITDVYLEYCMAADTYSLIEPYSSSNTDDIRNKTIWISPEADWSTTYPIWQSGYQIWIRQVTEKEGLPDSYGTPYLDKAVNQINNNVINLSDKLKAFFHPGDSSYSGAFVVGKTSEQGLDTADATTYGWNTRVATGSISMGYNKIPLVELGLLDNGNFTGLRLYSPILTNSEVTDHRLDASLTSKGLILSKGGIEAGTKNTQDYIYIYSSVHMLIPNLLIYALPTFPLW